MACTRSSKYLNFVYSNIRVSSIRKTKLRICYISLFTEERFLAEARKMVLHEGMKEYKLRIGDISLFVVKLVLTQSFYSKGDPIETNSFSIEKHFFLKKCVK